MDNYMDDYVVSTDDARLDIGLIHRWLSETSYWAKGVQRDVVERSLANSLNFAVYHKSEGQVGFARVITDRATFAYLADVFVLEAHRGKGLSKQLMAAVVAHPELRNLRRWLLATWDAHGLYAQFGFKPLERPERIMERVDPEIYARLKR